MRLHSRCGQVTVDKMAEFERTFVTLVCQRCCQPIKLNRSLSAIKLYEAVKPIEKAKERENSLSGHSGEGKLDDLLEKVENSQHYERLSNDIQFVTECFKLLSETGEIDHPLCNSCPEGAMDQYLEEIRLTEEALDRYKRVLDELKCQESSIGEDGNKLDQELEELKKEEAELLSELNKIQSDLQSVEEKLSQEKERERNLDSEEKQYWESFNEHQKQMLELRDQSFGTDLQLQYTRDQLSRLKRKSVLNTAFYISHNGHFATINGLRLGKLPSVPVEWSEINAAWGQTTLLLATLANICNISFTRYKLIPYGSQSFIQDMEGKKKQLPLYTGTRFFSDSRYDSAMVAFLDCLNQFKFHIETVSKAKFTLPYEIDRDRIGDGQEFYSIKVQFNTEERWTKALKFVLTDIRWGMTWVSANLLTEINS